jgi:hypothetical protein
MDLDEKAIVFFGTDKPHHKDKELSDRRSNIEHRYAYPLWNIHFPQIIMLPLSHPNTRKCNDRNTSQTYK